MTGIQCGFSRTRITPKSEGTWLDGYGFRVKSAEGIHRDLYVNLCALRQGETRFLIASFDFCGMSGRVYDLLSGQIEELTGIDRAHMALCATHTHSGPACGVLDLVPVNYDYFLWVGEQAGKCVREAFENAVPGAFDCRIAGEMTQSYNRRGRDPIDRRVKTAVFVDSDGRVRGSLVHTACHAVLNTSYLLSPDYPGVLNSRADDDCPTVVLAGRGADIDPILPAGADRFDQIERIGGEVADLLTESISLAVSHIVEETALRSVYEKVRLPMKPYPTLAELEKRIHEERARYLTFAADDVNRHYCLAELNWLYLARTEREAGREPSLDVPLQMLAVGDVLFVFVPFEPLTLTGGKLETMACRLGYRPECVFTVGYANSVNGYLAPEEEFAFGGYETEGAAHWYRLPECVPETERTLLRWYEEHMQF